ncbi:hypothetical protein [Lentibacillus saliphilus]|uniref:hypothetical protein n=1 Tax=Lentibacillus saliphilus TaxID=2737028 RepID=UPI001C3034CB|nr:hypothetical protein [Lentibacillus saliphilus]
MRKLLYKIALFFVPFIILYFSDIDYEKITNLEDILTASIAISSSSLGFFIAGVSILQTSSISRFYKKLVQLGTNKKIIAWLMTSIVYVFLLAFLSLFNMFLISDMTNLVVLLMDIWLALLIAAFLSTLFVIILIGIIFTS